MQLKSTDTYHVAFALEVVLSQGKRQDKTRFKGQDLFMDALCLTLWNFLFYSVVSPHWPAVQILTCNCYVL